MATIYAAADGELLCVLRAQDAAAGYLLLWELGCPVTDAAGRPLDGVPLIAEDGTASHVSTVAASNPELHAALVEAVMRGLDRAGRSLAALLS